MRRGGILLLLVLFFTDFGTATKDSDKGFKQLAFRQKILSTQQARGAIDAIVVLDESNSISDVDFDVARVACQQIVEQYSGLNVHFGIILFSNDPRTISPLSPDRASVLQALHDVSRLPGSTDTRAALAAAKRMFQDHGRRDAQRVVFLITDGRPNSSPVAEAFELRVALGATVFAIGVGQVDGKNLEDVASKGFSFLVTDFDELVKTLTPPPQPVDEAPRHRVSFQSFLRRFPLTTRENIPIRFTIRNQRPDGIPAGSRLFFRADPYLEPFGHFLAAPVAPLATTTIDIDLPVTAKASVATIPETISVTLESPDGAEIPSEFASIELSPEYFVGDLVAAVPSDPDLLAFNALVFGLVGHGKSSWINAVATALSHRIQELAAVGGTAGHVTTQLVRFSLPALHRNSPDIPPVPLNLWDTWGVTASNYNEDFLRELLEGRLPSGYKMTDRISPADAGVQQHVEKFDVRDREMHALVFLVHAGFEDDTNQTRRMTNCSALATRLGFSPIVVVTGMDKHQPSMHARIRTVTSETFAIPLNRVFLVTNYVNQAEKSFAIDKTNLEIVQHLLRVADAKVARRLLDEADQEASVSRAERRAQRLQREQRIADALAKAAGAPEPVANEGLADVAVHDQEDDLRRPDYKIAQERLRVEQARNSPPESTAEALARHQQQMQSRIEEHVAAMMGASGHQLEELHAQQLAAAAADAKAIEDIVQADIGQAHTDAEAAYAHAMEQAMRRVGQDPFHPKYASAFHGRQQPGAHDSAQFDPVAEFAGRRGDARPSSPSVADFLRKVGIPNAADSADAPRRASGDWPPFGQQQGDRSPFAQQQGDRSPFGQQQQGGPQRIRDMLVRPCVL
eukprot:TRINITY_DN6902_c0_g1_i3.p1 TRINITY_DN6902_c0_g1~~TRINITY_DN6902_c0_g1_i3.p1  ORF type:complete len:855 (-),score=256.66 TRINITY_DN6902_c0_g1_i3:132-2696(-)